MPVYYNEIDPFCAEWLRALMAEGLIARGDVDERSIEDVTPNDIKDYDQCHFFAGIGGWSYALGLTGWPDGRPVWTGSCPCQPFSAAGKGGGFADERHLWPAFHHLIRECRPAIVFGEQVASPDGLKWFDLVQTDMEGEGYACAGADICAAGIGAPHIRQRLWWVAHPASGGFRINGSASWQGGYTAQRDAVGGLGNTVVEGLERHAGDGDDPTGRAQPGGSTTASGGAGALDNTANARCSTAREHDGGWSHRPARSEQSGCAGAVEHPESEQEGVSRFARERRATSGYWNPADWIPCRDGKWRPVEPGTFPLAHGVPARVGRLRGYGNAIVPQVAAEFISAFI